MTLYCPACKQECFTREIDVGIGTFEFWGCRGQDVRLVTVSDCCEVEPTEGKPDDDDEDDC